MQSISFPHVASWNEGVGGESTHTTLLGWPILYIRTTNAITTTTASSRHSTRLIPPMEEEEDPGQSMPPYRVPSDLSSLPV